ncbi:MAG TPA: AarF/ABC1/UbiB kinase family protein [Candidatus Omnitrophica bacterium]|nr:AarF/ABC1/UbiB kinase family protein [Candidatus Omnitrophota bacterium]
MPQGGCVKFLRKRGNPADYFSAMESEEQLEFQFYVCIWYYFNNMEKPFRVGRFIPLRRYQEIIHVLVKYGFRMFLERIKLKRIHELTRGGIESREKTALEMPVKVRMICEELGGTFIKFGQLLSTRPDLLPLPLIRELEKLQDEIPSMPKEEIFPVVYTSLGEKKKMFASIEEKPIASGSLAQVHHGRLKTGEEVVLKVKKPGVSDVIKEDIQILYTLAHLLERFISEVRMYEPVRIVEEFEKAITQELNFSIEARNAMLLGGVLKEGEGGVPRVFEELSSSELLVMEYVEGLKLKELIKRGERPLNERISRKFTYSILRQIFTYGVFHCDPHPGNIIVDEDERLYFLDLGMVGRIREEKRRMIASLLYHLVEGNIERVMRALHVLKMLPEGIDRGKLEWALEEFTNKYHLLPLSSIRVSEVIPDILQIFRKFDIHIPSNFSLLLKALLTWEGVSTLLCPEKDLTGEMKRALRESISLPQILRQILGVGVELLSFSRELPEVVDSLRDVLNKGYINVAFEHKGLHDLTSTLDKSSRRISFSLIIAALIIASSLIIVSGKGPKWLGLPSIGVIGYILSGILGLWLVVSILRRWKR